MTSNRCAGTRWAPSTSRIRRDVMADKEIKVYSTPTCPWCRKAKEYLESKGVNYENYNVAEERDKLQEMVDLSGQRGVPVLKIGDEIIVGFNQPKIDQALAA